MKNVLIVLYCMLLFIGASHHGVQAAPVDYQYSPGTPSTEARAQWDEFTKGDDLARGKKVFFSPPPNYSLTTDTNDPFDLTDGTLSLRADDRIWFNKDAVGWYLNAAASNGVLMMVDLGSVQPVGQIAIRVLGGREQDTLDLPKKFEFLASVDGQQYYTLQSTVKLNEGEQRQADNKTSFYIPEERKAFVATFVCREAVRARYVALRITPLNSIFTDQISVLKATDGQRITELTSYSKTRVFTDGLAVLARQEQFVVTTNIATPNWLTVINNSNLDLSQGDAGFRLELPKGLYVMPQSQPAFKEVTSNKPDSRLYEFTLARNMGYASLGFEGPLWIAKEANAKIPANSVVTITGVVKGKDSHAVTYPLTLISIPESVPIKGFDVSLAWMGDGVQQEWPDFLRDFRKMGFGYVSTFPRYYGTDKDGSWNEGAQKKLEFIKQARADGYGILYNESPFHVMWENVQADLVNGRISDAEADQLFTQINGERGKNMNILYRGKYFQNEIKRVADLTALVQPDHAYLDIEWWTASVNESKQDPRVVAAWKASGKDWDDYVTDIGTEVLRDLVSALRKAAPRKKIVVGLYDSDPTHKIYNDVFAWDKIYPGIVDIAQPSLYIQGRSLLVADRVRYDYDAMQVKKIIPWLSTGTYGEYDPKLTEPMILESILNGSRGVTYYWFGDFDPMDFYYHAKAIKDLAPYEKLLNAGKPVAYKGANSDLHYTAFASQNEALVLVGNYNGVAQTKVLLPLPIKSARKVLLDGKALSIKNNTVAIEVPPGEFRLVYFGK